MTPFLRWAGGKSKQTARILSLLPTKINTYYEPFLGGGAVFLALDQGRMERAILSDTNQDLIATWKIVSTEAGLLVDVLNEYQKANTRDFYFQVRDMHFTDQVYAAARFIYLNKTCFNGLYRVNAKGQFNVPYDDTRKGPTRLYDLDNLQACSRALRRAMLYVCNFDILKPKSGDAVYFDPPYVPLSLTSSFTEYTPGGFGLEEQKRLRDVFGTLASRGVRVVLSQADVPFVRDTYRGFEMHEILAPRSINSKASGRGPVGELLIVGGPV